jgi:hypothetical protein
LPNNLVINSTNPIFISVYNLQLIVNNCIYLYKLARKGTKKNWIMQILVSFV